jgi:tetratricopeptide (TPR) repeat protein
MGAGVCFCASVLPVCAQSPRDAVSADAQGKVSVRDLSIPESARKNYAKSRKELVEQQEPECAIGHLRKAIATYPDYYEAWFLLGVAHMELKQLDKAESALRKSVSLSAEQFAQPLVALATLYSNQERYAYAAPLAAQAVELDETLWYAHYELARARFRLGSYTDALPSARRVAREHPEYAKGRLLLALIHAQLQQYDRALPHLDAYLLLDPAAPDDARMTALRAQVARAADSMHTAAAASRQD